MSTTHTLLRPLLSVTGLEVIFDGYRAIDGVDFAVAEGELRFLIGPNGAGKTTLIDAITGLNRPAAGSVVFGGTELLGRREHEIVHLGVGRSFQTPTIFESLSVLENVDLAASFRRPLWRLLRRRQGVADLVAETLASVGLDHLAQRPAGILSHGQRQWLEIAMLLVQEHRLILLDEPVAGMSPDERIRTGELLTSIAEHRTVVVVEHDMAFLRRFASRVTVMHEGRILCEGSVTDVQSNPEVQAVYLGRSATEAGHEATAPGRLS